jgi:hypothetical protein
LGSPHSIDPAVAWGAGGEAVAAWTQAAGPSFELWSARRPPTGGFGSATRVSTSGAPATAPDLAPSDALVTWNERGGSQQVKTARLLADESGSEPPTEPPPGPTDGAPAGPQGPLTLPPAEVASADTTRPVVSGARISSRLRLKLALSEPAGLTLSIERVRGVSKRRVTQLHRHGHAGLNAVRLPRRVHGRRLPAGRYRAVLQAVDASGNASKRVVVVFRMPRALNR